MKKTNAARLLDRLKIPYELVPYTYDEGDLSVEEIAAANGLRVAEVYKTLVVKGDQTGVLVAVVPGDRELDFKDLARASGNKKIALVAVKELPGLTGYLRGGCSPLGMKKDYPVYLEEQALDCAAIYVNAGARGLFLKLKPEDLRHAAQATIAPITNH